MSITLETAQEHANDIAVTCCRFEAGTVIEPSNLEDPNIIPDLEASGLLEIPDNCLKIGEVLGAVLKETVDALTPLTSDLVDGVKTIEGSESTKVSDEDDGIEEKEAREGIEGAAIPVAPIGSFTGSTVKIHIGEGKDINLEIPVSIAGGMPVAPLSHTSNKIKEIPVVEETEEKGEKSTEKIVRSLKRKHFKIDTVELGEETKIEKTKLTIRKDVLKDAIASQDLVVDMKLDIITPERYQEYSETIMDVQPIAVKEEGELGEGITRVIDGVIVMVTGTDENGVQIGEFGSSEGILDRNIMWGRPGSPDKGEIFIKTEVKIKAGTNMERPGPMAAHEATDIITQEIREALKKADDSLIVNEEEFNQIRRPGKKKVVIVKEIMGQGAMHDNFILPVEPAGTLGAKPNVDLGNVPVVVSPLQVLDGCIHALTCIGPASKETTRHYWREPLVKEAMNDEEIDLAGVIFVGSPQVNSEKFYVSKLLGMTVEAMDIDGAIVTTEGFGNNHIDFASHIEQIGMRGIPVVGVTFSAVQGQLVVGNPYMNTLVDNNKSAQGIENEILENNCLAPEDAVRAIYMLKARMAGEEIKEAERKWNPNVKLNNIEAIEKSTGRKIELEPNEQSLEKSKKRREIYEVE
ncbi:D-proline reductase (dithiol) proprotein PrdA [Paramaledivibacter caminithermalis]|uniref:D-proline reductase (Dithiol) PrdA n=1 Tax=Paramaledivibacter caminithermalis (strain DSM 15212 / CIP 107654 / DViRD3) TaxID=1121301 RepID=A0A1M6LIC0_PARC5|nr:D-proline reductase (dithiol) proprotein PrdA [Paramaledivibacter caminithermalis]SHJ70939.1 D-proline reductase (dithiol) PrdA [Paramaledivibacter caminithermalis DSM 15212]